VSHPLRIGYLVPHFPSHTQLGVWREMLALEASGHRIVPLALPMRRGDAAPQDWTQDALRRTAVPGRFPPAEALTGFTKLMQRGLALWLAQGGHGLVQPVFAALAPAQALLTAQAQHALDHLHVQGDGLPAMAAALARRMGGVRFSVGLAARPADHRAALRFVLEQAQFLRVPGRRLHESLAETGVLPEACPVLESRIGVDCGVFAPERGYAPPVPGRPLRLLAVGMRARSRGQGDLLGAMRQLIDQGVDVRLTIAGQVWRSAAPGGSDLDATLRRLRLQDHVRLAGPLPLPELRAALADAHLFVDARRDGLPGAAALEAMAMRVPVLATGAEDDPPLIRDGHTGLLVDTDAPGAIARAIRALSTDPERLERYATAGHAHVAAHFRVEDSAQALLRAIAIARGSEDAAAVPPDRAQTAQPAQAETAADAPPDPASGAAADQKDDTGRA